MSLLLLWIFKLQVEYCMSLINMAPKHVFIKWTKCYGMQVVIGDL